MKDSERIDRLESKFDDLLALHNTLDKQLALLQKGVENIGERVGMSKTSLAVWGGGGGTVLYWLYELLQNVSVPQ